MSIKAAVRGILQLKERKPLVSKDEYDLSVLEFYYFTIHIRFICLKTKTIQYYPPFFLSQDETVTS